MKNNNYIKSFQHNEELLRSYFDFTQSVFGFDLKGWRKEGHWKDQYTLHAITDNNRVLAGLGAAKMKVQIHKKDISAIQLGSVGVLPEYRGQGLSRNLMENVLDDYKHIPLIFLFASEDVSKFYMKFGFRRIDERYPLIHIKNKGESKVPVKITNKSQHLERLLSEKLQYSSIIDARGNTSFYWFHLLYSFSESIYYIKEKDIIFIAEYTDDYVDLYDVLSKERVSFDEIKDYIITESTNKVKCHFTPDWLDVDYEVVPRFDNALYVYGEFLDAKAHCKYPITSRT